MSDGLLWIFGYGSLVWRPAFPHRLRRPACIEGFARRFWQGSTDHRGLPENPGRVVTLLANDDPDLARDPDFRPSPCWGTAYAVPIDDPHSVLEGLDHRERGGYVRADVTIRIAHEDECGTATADLQTVEGLVYVARPDNQNYLGPAPLESLVGQVADAVGPSGPNPEYVFELARSLRSMGRTDEHVFAVERALRDRLAAQAPS